MTAATRITELRRVSPAAADLALLCSLAVRVEPQLLRGLRLLLPHAGPETEADLYFSDLVTARDVTALALDPPVARLLRHEFAAPRHAKLLREAWQLVHTAHRDGHWSVRLEEQVNHLDAARPPDARKTIEDLLLAGLSELAHRPDRKGVARWLLGAVARLPADIAEAPVSRAAHVAAGALLDGRADRVDELLTPAEGAEWLPWLLDALPTTTLHVQLLDGAVVLGTDDPDALELAEVPQTDPLVAEVRWQNGEQARSVRVGVTPGEPVRVETGTDLVTLVFLSGLAYRLSSPDRASRSGAPWHAAVKARLRPCLAREQELDELRLMLTEAQFDRSWIAVWGPRDSGKSVLLVAAADELRARGIAVIEHFYGSGPPERDHPEVVAQSLLAQLLSEYPDFELPAGLSDHPYESNEQFARVLASESAGPHSSGMLEFSQGLMAMTAAGAFKARPLLIVLDGLTEDERSPLGFGPLAPVPEWLTSRVRCLVAVRTGSRSRGLPRPGQEADEVHFRPLTEQGNQRVCHAMLARDRGDLDRAFAVPVPDDTLTDLVDGLPGRLDQLIGWLRSRPAGAVEIEDVPPSLTAAWDSELSFFARELGLIPASWLVLLAAADGLNTWADCAQSMSPPEGSLVEDFWPWLKDVFTNHHLAEPTLDDMVRLADPSVGERLRELDTDGTGLKSAHRRLADLTPAPSSPLLVVERTSQTRRAAAVHHALQADEVSTAVRLCLNLRYLRARYAEDPAALSGDVVQVADRTGNRPVAHLRQAVHTLVTAQVPPADFAVRLYDQLHAQAARAGWIDELFAEPLGRPPLAVSHVLDDHDLQRGAVQSRFEEGRYLAAALMGFGTLVLVTPTAVLCPEYGVTEPFPGGPVRGAVAGSGDRIVAWSDHDVVAVDFEPPSTPRFTVLRPPAVEVGFAAATPSGAVLASADGTAQYLSSISSRPGRLLVGHGARITAAVEREVLITASEDGTVRLWDTGPDPSRSRVFTHGEGAVRAIELVSGDGSGFVTGGDDGWLRWWDAGSPGGSPVDLRAGHEGPVLALTVLRDGRVVTASADATLRIWDRSAAEPLVLTGHEDAVTGCRETSRGIMSWSADGTVRHWPLQGGPAWEVARGFPGGIGSVSVRGDEYALLCGDGSVERRVLISQPGQPRESLGALANVGMRAVAGLGWGLVTVGRNGVVGRVESLSSVLAAMSATSSGGYVTALDTNGRLWEFEPSGSGFAPVDEYRTGPLELMKRAGLPDLERIAWLDNGVLAASAGRHLWLASWMIADAEIPGGITSIASVGRMAAVGTAVGDVHLLHPATGHTVRVLTGGPGPVEAVTAVSGYQVATGAPDGTIRLIPLDSAAPAQQLFGHTGAVTALARVGDLLVSGGADGLLLLWGPGSSKPVHTVGLGGAVTALAAGEGWLAARDATGSLWLLEVARPGGLQVTSVATVRGVSESALVGPLNSSMGSSGRIVAGVHLRAHADLELSALATRTGGTTLPIDLWFDPVRPGSPRRLPLEPDGRLRLPLWLRAGESTRLWAVSASVPSGPVEMDFLISSPQLRGGRAMLTYR